MLNFLPPLKPHFEAALRDVEARYPRYRALAAQSLGAPPEGREEEARVALRWLADDPNPEVRASAVQGLGRVGTEDDVGLIVARVDDGDETVRQVAIMGLAELGDAAGVPRLKEAIGDPRGDVRFQAAAALALLDADAALEALPALVDDEDPEVRMRAAEALGALERPEAAEALGILVEDPRSGVRAAAALALARIGDGRGAGELIVALGDRDRCFEAAWALGEVRAEEAIEPLARLAGRWLTPLAVRAAAAAALVRLGDPRGLQHLRAVLTALRSDARSYAAELVGELGCVELVPELAALAQRPRGADRVVVAQALAKLAPKDERAARALEALAKRDDEAGERARRLIEG